MRTLEVSQQAQTEIVEIRFFTRDNWGIKQSDKYLTEFQITIDLLRKSPLIGVKRTDLSSETYSFPYVSHMIYYKFNEKTLYLLAVLHKNRLPKNHMKDLNP